MNINLELYKVFYYVAKNKSISRAAEDLLISQPAVSKSIKNLEEHLNVSLFKRVNNGVELTEYGEKIYEKVDVALELINSAEVNIMQMLDMQEGTIALAASNIIIHEYLMDYIVKFNNKYPKIKLKIISDGKEIEERFRLGLIDIVFTNMPSEIPENVCFKRLVTVNNCFVANEKFSMYKNKKLSINDLEKLPLLLLKKGTINRSRIDEFAYHNNLKIKPVMEFDSNTLVKKFALNGFGIGMLDEESIKEELKENKLFKLDIDVQLDEKYLGLYYNKENKNILVDKFLDILQQ